MNTISGMLIRHFMVPGAGLLFLVPDVIMASAQTRPNIIYILADDLGYGDPGCYGQKKFSTPNIDRLAEEGIRFTQHYAGCTVCAPSRSSLMTGLHTGHTPIRGNREIVPEGQQPIPEGFVTLGELMKKAGYNTGAFGKWGLGAPGTPGDPNNRGFDEFFGFNCQRLAHNYYPYYLWHNHEKIILEGNQGKGREQYAPRLIHQKALEFIRKNNPASTGKPFFVYYPTTIPHAELFAPEKFITPFRNKFLPEKKFSGVDDGPQYKLGPYGSQPEAHAAFAGMVTCLDDQVGELISLLKELNLDRNTLVIFSSDNGPHLEGGADPDYFNSNGPFRGYKRDVYEGGIREPMIAWWPGTITGGRTTDLLSAFWDVMPTLLDLAGVVPPAGIDGISMLPTLLGKSTQKKHDYLYWEFHEQKGKQAVRAGKWKAVRLNLADKDNCTTELYDLEKDPGEEKNLAGQYPSIVKKMTGIMNAAHKPNDVFILKGVDEIKIQY